MQSLKKEIVKVLKVACPNVYFEHAPADSSTPYLVYDLAEGIGLNGFINVILDIDIWDKDQSSANVDSLAKALRKLDGFNYINQDIQFRMYFDRNLNSKSESQEWKRNTTMFTIKLLERS